MIEHNEKQSADVLDQATVALRHMPIPEGPPAQLAAATVVTLQSAAIPPNVFRHIESKRKMFRLMRYSGVTAAVVLLAGLAAWLYLLDRTASPAFADVVNKVKDAKSVTFVTKIPTIIQGAKKGVLQTKVYIQGDAYRMEISSAQEGIEAPVDAPAILMAFVVDWKKKSAIQLDYTAKVATKIKTDGDDKMWQEMAKAMADPIKQLRNLKEQDAERVGEEQLNGQKTIVYRLKKTDIFMGLTISKDETAKLWVDPKTNLPVRIAVGDPMDLVKPFVVFEQFTWNESLDPDLFKLEMPKGFTLKDQ